MGDRQIVVIGSEDDGHLKFVQPHLEAPLVVINPSSVAGPISIEFGSSGSSRLSYLGGVIDTSEVASVWYRRGNVTKLWPGLNFPLPAKKGETSDEIQKRVREEQGVLKYAYSALQHLANGVVAAMSDAFWVSSPHDIRAAECKPDQLQRARELGFGIPETIMTSDADAAKAFARRHGQVILKPLANIGPGCQDQYAMLVTAGDIDFGPLIGQPHILQRPLEPEFEVRVSVIGSQVISAKVADRDSALGREQGIRDYRLAFNSKTSFQVEPIRLPSDVEERCVRFARSYGTPCAFIDLIYSGGRYWFLENNPNGQWGFKDDVSTDLIGRALARLLAKGAV